MGLAGVTYLFEGELLHREIQGSGQPIGPGSVGRNYGSARRT
jgi:redox-sensitive bicupin YhaK (pirin superfamily)